MALTPLGDAETTTDPGPDVATGLSYGDVGEFADVVPGRYAVSLRATGTPPTTPPVLSARVEVRPGSAGTVAIGDVFADLQVQVLRDDLSTPPPGRARVRVLNAAVDAGALDLTLPDGTSLAGGLSFPGAGPAVPVPAGPTTLRLAGGSGSTEELPLDLAPGSVVTLLVLDRPGGGLDVRAVLDAAGTQQVPTGAVEAGAGPGSPAAPAPAAVIEVTDEPAAPTGLAFPSIGTRTALTGIGLTGEGALVPPADARLAGWFAGSALPGQPGPAVIAGHVDWAGRPGAFARIDRLAVGDPVVVARADGTTQRFAVTRVERHLKAAFPAGAVYGTTPHAELRLITCGGAFDPALGSYVENVVVFAEAESPAVRPGPPAGGVPVAAPVSRRVGVPRVEV